MGTWGWPWGHWDHGDVEGAMGTWVRVSRGGHRDRGDTKGTQRGHNGDRVGAPRGPPHLALQVQVVVEELAHLLVRVLLRGGTGTRGHLRGRVSPPGGCHPHPADPPPATHQRVAALGQGDELLVGGRAHVEADGQHLLQGGHDERGVDGVAVAPALLLRPLLLRAAPLGTGTGASAPPSTDMGWGHRQSHGGGGGEAAGSVVEAMGSWSRPWGPHQGHGVMVKAMGIPLLRPWGHDQGHGVMVKVMGTPSRSWGHH